MDIIGKIERIGQTVQVSDKFAKREFVVEYAKNPQYPEYINMQFVQDKCGLLDMYQVGQEVQVFFDLRGRKWTGSDGVEKVFNTVQAWRIALANGQQPQPAQAPPNDAASVQPQPQPTQAGPTPQTQQMLTNAGMTATVAQQPATTAHTQPSDGIPF